MRDLSPFSLDPEVVIASAKRSDAPPVAKKERVPPHVVWLVVGLGAIAALSTAWLAGLR